MPNKGERISKNVGRKKKILARGGKKNLSEEKMKEKKKKTWDGASTNQLERDNNWEGRCDAKQFGYQKHITAQKNKKKETEEEKTQHGVQRKTLLGGKLTQH